MTTQPEPRVTVSRKCAHYFRQDWVCGNVCDAGVRFADVRQLPPVLNRAWLLPCIEADGISEMCSKCRYEEPTK